MHVKMYQNIKTNTMIIIDTSFRLLLFELTIFMFIIFNSINIFNGTLNSEFYRK